MVRMKYFYLFVPFAFNSESCYLSSVYCISKTYLFCYEDSSGRHGPRIFNGGTLEKYEQAKSSLALAGARANIG